MGLVDGSQAPVGVVVGAGACTESTHCTVIENWFNTEASNKYLVAAIHRLVVSVLFHHKSHIHTRPEGSRLPVVIIMCEASESRQTAVISLPLPLLLLPFLLPSPDLIVQLGLHIYFLRSFPVGTETQENYQNGGTPR